MRKEERYTKTQADGTSESRVIVETPSSGVVELCVMVATIAIAITVVALVFQKGKSCDFNSSRRLDFSSTEPQTTMRENFKQTNQRPLLVRLGKPGRSHLRTRTEDCQTCLYR